MTDQLLDKPPEEITRRKFLTLSKSTVKAVAFGSVAGTGLGTLVGWLIRTYGPTGVYEFAKLGLSAEVKQMLPDIVRFRQSLGLEGLPAKILIGLSKNEKWQPGRNFENALPEINRSFGQRISEILFKMFGPRATNLVYGAKEDPGSPFGMSFSPSDRHCNVSRTVHDIDIGSDFADYVLHEACGHGSDPTLETQYPTEILLRVEYGKWQALSQALSVDKQFLNHPNDLTYPLLKRSLGETFGSFYTEQRNMKKILDPHGLKLIMEDLQTIASARGKNVRDLAFNKKLCSQIGERLVTLRREGKSTFSANLKESYETAMEHALVEIYAEMVKYSVRYPHLIGNNRAIIEGITQVCTAIKGEPVDLNQLKAQIEHPSPEITIRNASEKALIPNTPANSAKPSVPVPISPEDQERAKKQQEEFEYYERLFNSFLDAAVLPDSLQLDVEQKIIVDEFAQLCSAVTNKYPMLKDTFASQYDESFDPEIHIWDIKKIEQAMDSGFIRSLIKSRKITPVVAEKVKTKNNMLKLFVASGAF